MSILPLFDVALLIPLFIIGGICSYTDVKYGKIFNKWIKIGFLWGVFFHALLFFYNSFFLFEPSKMQYLIEVVANTSIAFFVGYFIWRFGLWSAGDAKLFTLYSLLLPLKFYSKSYLPYFPSFNLLVNLFIPLLIALMLSAFLSGIGEIYKKRHELKIKKLSNIKNSLSALKAFILKLFSILLSYIFISICFKNIAFLKKFVPGVEFLFNPYFLFFLMFVVYGFLSKIESKKEWVSYFIKGIIIVYCSFLLFFGKAEELKLILKQALVFMVLITLLRQVLSFYIEKKEVKEIKIKDLQKGVVVSNQDLSHILNQLRAKNKEKEFERIRAEGLSKKQVTIIKNLFVENPDFKIRIYKTFPFAPFMLLSVIISILTKNSIVASLI